MVGRFASFKYNWSSLDSEGKEKEGDPASECQQNS